MQYTANYGRKKNKIVNLRVALLALIAITIPSGSIFYAQKLSTHSPVPKKISQNIAFAIYYPNPKKLPESYHLDATSFKIPEPNILLYSVEYGRDKIVFSLQKQPADSEIQRFYTNYMPLQNKFHTDLGEARIGAYGKGNSVATIVSLPVNNGPWIIATAPTDINQDQIKQVVQSLTK